MDVHTKPLVWFADIDTEQDHVSAEVRKIANLYQAGFPVLPGFVITNTSFQQFIKENNLEQKIRSLLTTIDPFRPDSIAQGASIIRRAIQDAPIPSHLEDLILSYYHRLDATVIAHAYSAPKHGFKHSTKHVTTDEEILSHIKDVWISQFDPETLMKRHQHGLDHITSGVEVIILPHFEPEVTGKTYTIHHEHHFKDTLIITHLGDTYELSKKNLTILKRNLAQHKRHIKLTHEEIIAIARLARDLEKHLYFPQEITWAFFADEVIILQTKPVSTHPKVKPAKKVILPIARGTSITKTIGSGIPMVISKDSDLEKLTNQHIMVVSEIKPHYLKRIKHVKGVISEKGELHSEVATHLRSHGIPSVFHVSDARNHFKHNHVVTIHAGKGEIYRGGLH